jgi:hypothetical protein
MNPKAAPKDDNNKDGGVETGKELQKKPQEKIRSKHAFFQFQKTLPL